MAIEAARAGAREAATLAEPAGPAMAVKSAQLGERRDAQPLWVRLRDVGAAPDDALRVMSGSFEASFGDVALADDPAAHAEAQQRHAAAFTHGQRIAFAPGRLAPGTPSGAFTLAHELAHVLQLRAGADPSAQPGAEALLEQEADQAARDVLASRRPALDAKAAGSVADLAEPPAVLRQDEQAAGSVGQQAQQERAQQDETQQDETQQDETQRTALDTRLRLDPQLV